LDQHFASLAYGNSKDLHVPHAPMLI